MKSEAHSRDAELSGIVYTRSARAAREHKNFGERRKALPEALTISNSGIRSGPMSTMGHVIQASAGPDVAGWRYCKPLGKLSGSSEAERSNDFARWRRSILPRRSGKEDLSVQLRSNSRG
jgi:hypothetical protein